MKEVLVDIENISVRNNKCALNNINISIYKKEFLIFLGLNINERLLLMNTISGAITQNAGNLCFCGDRKKDIVIIDDKLQLVPQMTIAENLVLFSPKTHMGLLSFKRLHEKAYSMLKLCNLDVNVQLAVEELTLYQHVLLLIAKAVSNDVKLIVLQNIIHVCSDKDLEGLYIIIEKLLSMEITVIISEDRMSDIVTKAHRLVIIDNSQIVRILYKGEFSKENVNTLLFRHINKFHDEMDDINVNETENRDEVKWVIQLNGKNYSSILRVRPGKVVGLIDARDNADMFFFDSQRMVLDTILCNKTTLLLNNFAKLKRNKIALFPSDINKVYFPDLTHLENILVSSYEKVCKYPNVIHPAFYDYAKKKIVGTGTFDIESDSVAEEDTLLKIETVLNRFRFQKTELLIVQSPNYVYGRDEIALIHLFATDLIKRGGSIVLVAKNKRSLFLKCDAIHVIKRNE